MLPRLRMAVDMYSVELSTALWVPPVPEPKPWNRLSTMSRPRAMSCGRVGSGVAEGLKAQRAAGVYTHVAEQAAQMPLAGGLMRRPPTQTPHVQGGWFASTVLPHLLVVRHVHVGVHAAPAALQTRKQL